MLEPETRRDALRPADFERELGDRYDALASRFDAEEEVLATWGMTAAMPTDLRVDVFDLWSSHIDARGGGQHSAAMLRTDRANLEQTAGRLDRIPVRDFTHRRERFRILFAAIDREGEILRLWGMTSRMPVELQTLVFDLWRACFERNQREENDHDARRSLCRLEADAKRLEALRSEPSA